MRRRKLYRGLAVAFSAILMATSNPATLQNVAAKGIHLQKKAKAKMISRKIRRRMEFIHYQ